MAAPRGDNERIIELINRGADPNGRFNRRPLEITAENEHPETVILLKKLGATSNGFFTTRGVYSSWNARSNMLKEYVRGLFVTHPARSITRKTLLHHT